MSAYNWIEFHHQCSACGQRVTARAQIHLASSYDGDDTGRFFERTYRVGEKMSWWDESDRRFGSWTDERDDVTLDHANEACITECGSCGAEFNVVVTLKSFVVESISPTDTTLP